MSDLIKRFREVASKKPYDATSHEKSQRCGTIDDISVSFPTLSV
jgi:hypothetical protein